MPRTKLVLAMAAAGLTAPKVLRAPRRAGTVRRRVEDMMQWISTESIDCDSSNWIEGDDCKEPARGEYCAELVRCSVQSVESPSKLWLFRHCLSPQHILALLRHGSCFLWLTVPGCGWHGVRQGGLRSHPAVASGLIATRPPSARPKGQQPDSLRSLFHSLEEPDCKVCRLPKCLTTILTRSLL